MTLFSALAAVLHTQAMKPNMSKLGSKPDAMTTPSTTGTREQYTRNDSRFERIRKAKAAVKNGVVELMACRAGSGDQGSADLTSQLMQCLSPLAAL